MLKQTTTTKQ